MSRFKVENVPFKPRARLLRLLGDQLIRDPGIAVFELVKNAYDADSPYAKVTMSHLEDKENGEIVVEDAGTGMDLKTVIEDWLEPGTDYRARQREGKNRSHRYGRLPLGEKGVGRFAAHKLGSQITLVSRKKGHPEIIVEIDWDSFSKHKYLSDVPIEVKEREPQFFRGQRTGTRIEVTKLHSVWNKVMVRELARAINSICSPFDKKGEFKAELVLTENPDWLKGIFSVDKALEYALFRAHCDIHGKAFSYTYEFTPFPTMERRVEPRKVKHTGKQSRPLKLDDHEIELIKKKVGPVHIDLYIFDREPRILELGVTDRKGLKEFLDQSGGIRVYRDGIRVYDYGEPGNDWLNLGGQRVNVPTKRISNNLVVGAVSLRLDESPGLIEKTNREGFVDNPAFRAFAKSVDLAVTEIETERNIDKTRIRNAYSSKKIREPILEDLTELRDLVEKKKLTEELGPYLDRIESDFTVIRERFLTSASAGLSLSVVIHEVEKGVSELETAVKREQASHRIKMLAKHLADLVEGFAALIRRSGTSREQASALISQALFNTELRLKNHDIEATVDLQQGDFEVKCSRRLTISTLMNLIDNSIWWLDNKWGDAKGVKRIYVGTSKHFSHGRAIIVADNGPGFVDPPEYLIEPFISRKPDGMGLGLHIADQVMKGQGGKLEFPQPSDLSLPKGFDGAVVALVFGGTNK